MTGTIGAAFWNAIPEWSAPIDHAFRARLAQSMGVAIPARVSSFIDIGARAATDDLFFSRAVNQSPLLPEPRVIEHVNTVLVPLDLIAFVALVLLAGGFLLRRAFFPH
ncbi:MAG: hypothetical protein ACJ74H_19215 [Thermoanaerobaculia bacterium]